jgi:hypothetical protein
MNARRLLTTFMVVVLFLAGSQRFASVFPLGPLALFVPSNGNSLQGLDCIEAGCTVHISYCDPSQQQSLRVGHQSYGLPTTQ